MDVRLELTGLKGMVVSRAAAAVCLCLFVVTGVGWCENNGRHAEAVMYRAQQVSNMQLIDFASMTSEHDFDPLEGLPSGTFVEVIAPKSYWENKLGRSSQALSPGTWVLSDLRVSGNTNQAARDAFDAGATVLRGKAKLRRTLVAGVDANCLESSVGKLKQTACFDAQTGVLLVRKGSTPYEVFSYEYSEHQKVGTKFYPGRMRYTSTATKLSRSNPGVAPSSSLTALK